MAVQSGEIGGTITGSLRTGTTSRQQAEARLTGTGFTRFPVSQISFVVVSDVIAWPATLPQCPILNGFSEQKQPNNVSFTPDVGPPKMRRRSTGAAWGTSVTYRMTTAELTAFNAFYESDLSDGTLPFSWRHPIQLATYYWNFDPKEAPRIDRVTPGTFRVSFNLLRLP